MKKTALPFFASLTPSEQRIKDDCEKEIAFHVEMKALHLDHIGVLEQHIAFLQKTVQSQRETIDLQAESIRLLKELNAPTSTPAFTARGVGIA